MTKYKKFIESRPKRKWKSNSGYCKHHVVMKSLGGTDDADNLIILTEREHYIAHMLLWAEDKSCDKKALAFYWMSKLHNKDMSSREYAALREKAIAVMRENTRICWQTTRRGWKHSDETRKRISENNKGRQVSPITREKIASAQRGKPRTYNIEESVRRENISKGLKGVRLGVPLTEGHILKLKLAKRPPHTEETKEKISKGNKGKVHPQEVILKISESVKKQWVRQKENNYISPLKGRPISDEVKKKISSTLKGRASPKNLTDEQRKEASERMKLVWQKKREEGYVSPLKGRRKNNDTRTK